MIKPVMFQRFRPYLIAAVVLVAALAALRFGSNGDRSAAAPEPSPASASQAPTTMLEPPRQAAADIVQAPVAALPQSVPAIPERQAQPAVIRQPNPPAAIESPASPAVAARGHLDAEDAFVTDRMVDVRSLGALVKGDDFERVMDELSAQSARSPLAKDLTALYSAAAAQASGAVDGVATRAMACGLKLCIASMTAASADAMTAWMKAVLTHPQAKVYSMGRHDRTLPDGSVQYRLVFSIDPAIRAVGARPRG